MVPYPDYRKGRGGGLMQDGESRTWGRFDPLAHLPSSSSTQTDESLTPALAVSRPQADCINTNPQRDAHDGVSQRPTLAFNVT